MTNIARKLLSHSEVRFPIIIDAKKPKTLFELLNVYPDHGVGIKVAPDHWVKKGITGSYYEITKVSLKMKDITHGKAFGIKVWDDKVLNKGNPVRIQAAYKWNWMLWPIDPAKRNISWG